MRLLIGTKNRGKIIEISEALAGLNVECVAPHAIGIPDDPEETGDTFEENALQKARYYFQKTQRTQRTMLGAAGALATLADDSGIIVEALEKELGIHTRRWGAGPKASDEEWITYFLERMRKEKNKRAHFVCVLAYIDEQGKEHLFKGTCNGVITENLEAEYLPGLPISACFKPDGFDCVYSAMKIEQKNSTSHRGKAVAAFRRFLKTRSR